MIQLDSSRLARIMDPSFHLRQGKGNGINGQMDACAQQALRYLLGLDSASDKCPDCVSPIIHSYSMGLNDKMTGKYRDKLKNYLVMQTGTKGSLDLDIRRAFKLADHAVRFTAANALDAAGLEDKATELRLLPEIVDKETSYAARAASAAASDAASAAAWSASSASDAASNAAMAATSSAASDAASAAASDAASAAAWSASSASDAASIWDAELALLKQLCEMKDGN